MKLRSRFISSVVLVVILVIVFLFSFRWVVYSRAVKTDTVWNDNKSCYIDTRKPTYSGYGGPGRILALISSESFFVVYTKGGKALKSSANYFWEHQFSDVEGAKWVNGFAMYPTTSGWSGWRLAECG